MEWERAKTYILIFFVVLNIGLGFLIFMENRRYTVGTEQERQIRTVLNNNNISMYTQLMRRFPPMRPLNVTGFYYDTDTLVEILFDNPQDVERRVEFGRQTFRYGNSSMTISNGFIFFENPDGFRQEMVFAQNSEITHAHASLLTDEFIRSYFEDFVQDSHFEVRGGIRIIYRQMYRGQLVHSNFIEFLVTPIGIEHIEMQFGQILGHADTPLMIFSPDEALITFVQRVSHMTQEAPMTIVHMDLVYFQEYISDQPSVYHAVPFYRIFTRCSDDRPYLINAFTNVIID